MPRHLELAIAAAALGASGCITVSAASDYGYAGYGVDLHGQMVAGMNSGHSQATAGATATANANAGSQQGVAVLHDPPRNGVGWVGSGQIAVQSPAVPGQAPQRPSTAPVPGSSGDDDGDGDPSDDSSGANSTPVANDSAARFAASNCPPGDYSGLSPRGPVTSVRNCGGGIFVAGHGRRPTCRPGRRHPDDAQLIAMRARVETDSRGRAASVVRADQDLAADGASDGNANGGNANGSNANGGNANGGNANGGNANGGNASAVANDTANRTGTALHAGAAPANDSSSAARAPRRRQRNARERRALDLLARTARGGAATNRLASAMSIASEDLVEDGPIFYNIPIVGRSIAIIVDVSYSMSEPDPRSNAVSSADRASKLDVLRVELAQLLGALPTGTAVNLVSFSSETHQLWDAPRALDDANLEDAIRWIGNLRPEDETHPVDAVRRANGMNVEQVILLTDGRPTYASAEEPQLLTLADTVARRHARLDAVGIGPDQNASFLDTMTARGRGVAAHR